MRFCNLHTGASIAALALLAMSPLSAFSLPEHNVPNAVGIATDQGLVDPIRELNLTVVLKMHNRAEFDKVVEGLYDPASASYRQWLTEKDFEQYAPTVAEFETVKNELVKQGFSVLSSDPQRFSIRVHGTVEIVERAFQTELHSFSYRGKTFQAHTRDAQLGGAAGALVDSVSGIERHDSYPQLSYVKNPLTGKPVVKKVLATKLALTAFKNSLTDAPLTQAASELWAGDEYAAFYYGLQYAANGQTVAFTPSQLQAHYGLTTLIGEGYDGAGQTIALVEAYGYPTEEADANAAATLFGLPALSWANFSVIYSDGLPVSPIAGIMTGWDTEIALDIQSAHSIAPGAKIVVVTAAGEDNEDMIASLNYIVTNKIANTVSSSWEAESEIVSGTLEEEAYNTVLELGAAAGISFQFSTGDEGDQGLGTPVGAVSAPSNSPYATAVGGTSVLNNPYGTGQIVTGWGNNVVTLYEDFVYDPLEGYYSAGAGGGQSQYFKKPSWQSALTGSWRQVPDVSALADPYTGFPIIITEGGVQFGEVYGGTSLASPIFTAIWAIADQFNGKALGQAAPIVSKLGSGQITDVVPPSASIDQYNVTGLLRDSRGLTSFSAPEIYTEAQNYIAAGKLSLYSQKGFLSVLWPGAYGVSQIDVAVSFGTDTSLTVTTGWDNVTGWGEPNGLPFIQGVTGKKTGAPVVKK
jgi:subtilase family serine protease